MFQGVLGDIPYDLSCLMGICNNINARGRFETNGSPNFERGHGACHGLDRGRQKSAVCAIRAMPYVPKEEQSAPKAVKRLAVRCGDTLEARRSGKA